MTHLFRHSILFLLIGMLAACSNDAADGITPTTSSGEGVEQSSENANALDEVAGDINQVGDISLSTPSETIDMDAPVARVGSEFISSKEFLREMQMMWQRMEMEQGGHVDLPPNFRMDVLNALIDARIMHLLAKNEGIEVSDTSVEKEFELRKSVFPTEEAYEQYLQLTGVSSEELLTNIRKRITVSKFLDSLTSDDMVVPEEDLEEEYEQRTAAGMLQRMVPTVDVAHILIRVEEPEDESAWEEALERITSLRQRIEAGEAFEDVAREKSEDYMSAERGGLYTESTRGRVPQAIEDVMFTLEPGEMSEPLRGIAGWHLIEVKSYNEPGLMTYEEVREYLEKELMERKQVEIVGTMINQAKLVMNIEVYDEAVNAIPLEDHHHH